MDTNTQIQEVKWFICNYAFSANWNNASRADMANDAETVIGYVATANLGFASEIAQTVEKYKKISEKQAYWIAKAAVENNKAERISYLFEQEEAEA